MQLNRIINDDCLEAMNEIPDKSISLIVTDLPYGQTHNHWDTVIPFEPLWKQYERIIKDNGAIVLFAQGMFTAKLMMSNPKLWRYNLVWKKGNRISGFLNAKRQPLRNHEDICVFYKKQPIYHPQFTQGKPLHARGSGKHKFTNNNYGDFRELEDTRAGSTEKYPISVLDFDRPHPAIHGTEKPVDLIAYIIRTYSNVGDTVLDSCAGSGTTAIAAIQEKRNWICIEKDTEIYQLAKKMIENLTICPICGKVLKWSERETFYVWNGFTYCKDCGDNILQSYS